MLTAFELNGLACSANCDEAIRLETEAMEILDGQPGPIGYEVYLRRALLAFNRAQVYRSVGRYDEAVADITTVIDLFPRGRRVLQPGRPALADYNAVLELDPDHVDTLLKGRGLPGARPARRGPGRPGRVRQAGYG